MGLGLRAGLLPSAVLEELLLRVKGRICGNTTPLEVTSASRVLWSGYTFGMRACSWIYLPSLPPKSAPPEFICRGNSSHLEVPGVKCSCFLRGQGYPVVTAFSNSVGSSPTSSSFPAVKGSTASEPLGHGPASRVPAEAPKRLVQCYPPASCVPFTAGSSECQP